MEESCSCSTSLHDGDMCPICLNCLLEQEIGVPENCSHTFCMTCILKWAEIQVEKQQKRKKEEEYCAWNKEKYSHAKLGRFLRLKSCMFRQRAFSSKIEQSCEEEIQSQFCFSFHTGNILCDKQNKKALSVKVSEVGSDNKIPEDRPAGMSASGLASIVRSQPVVAMKDPFLAVGMTGTLLLLESLGKGYAVACAQEGEEKKQASGSSGARGARRKSVSATPRRRSARNTKNETLSQSRSSPRSSSSGCSAPGGSNPPLNKCSSESENVLPKRKPKRIGKQQTPLAKKKLRSCTRSEKSSSDDSVDDNDDAESEAVLTVEKDQQSDNESSSANLPEKSEAETEPANGLESCNERAEIEETAGECEEGTSGNGDVSFSVQESPVLTSGGGSQEFEIKDLNEKNVELKNEDACENTLEEMETATSPSDKLSDHATFENLDETCSPQEELHENINTLTNVHQPVTSAENKLPEDPEPLEQDQPLESPRSVLHEHTETTEVDDSKTDEKTTVDCASTNTQNLKTDKGKEPDVLMCNASTDSASEQALKESPVPEGEECKTSESLVINAEHKHFGDDNNEMIPMDCDSFCSDQNEPHIEQLPPAESVEQGKMDSLQSDAANSTSVPGFSDEKDEAIHQGDCQSELKKDKKTRTRRSRFHSPSTTWSPSRREGRRSQSPSPQREMTGERSSRSPKKEIVGEGRRSLSKSPKREMLRDERKTPSRSPKWEAVRESRRSSSRSRTRDSSPRQKSRSRSSDRDCQRRDRDRERRNRRWSRSRSRSRSRSQSRTRNKGSSFSRNERDGHSPRWKDRWANDSWRSPRGNDRYKRSDQEKQNESLKEKDSTETNSDAQCSPDRRRNDCPDWVMERINSVPEVKNRDRPHWEDSRYDNSGQSWNRNFGSCWIPNRGRGHRGRGGRGRGGFAYGDQSENHWQNRKPLSGNTNGSGNETARFSEQQPYKRKIEQDSFDTPADRSGWTSASSWAVRKTLPADVQNYYSRRGRNSSSPQSGWGTRQEEETLEQDPNLKDQGSQQNDGSQLPVNMMQQQMNVMPQVNAQHQPMNMFPYPVGVPPPMMNMQRNPFTIPPPVPMHLHTGVPLMQVAAPTNLSQGLPPPPPPPPPSQQVNYIASQQDGKQLQSTLLLGPALEPESGSYSWNAVDALVFKSYFFLLGRSDVICVFSRTTNCGNDLMNRSARYRRSNIPVCFVLFFCQKLLIQEKAAQEVKLAIKPFYQNKDITKEEYKEIVRKAVDKVCHSKSGEVNSAKVANLVRAYVDKYKHSRKKNAEEAISCERK
ncbi:hypothetical protein ASZ78_016926 [Callipepla squamata]|uniref:RING-type domain-containing protein n=1 Tax=Callipepla squamata TaxID=9009 RepID=A0A226N360_CALSU|nr:hypothetical protein ASZ78_016926 [Callipepla squamata]